jgi:glycosyltransferase involved in cell wall biosynthesis
MKKNVHFIFSGTQNALGGGTKVWKILLKEPPFQVNLHYSSYAKEIWRDFNYPNLIHHVHKDWKTFENRNYRAYDDSYLSFNFDLINDGDIVIFDSREGVQQLSNFLYKNKKEVKMIWHMQSEEHLLRKNLKTTFKDLVSLQHIDRVIAVSKFVKERFENDIVYKIFSKKIDFDVVYNPVESSFNKIKAKKNLVLFFGRFERYKNPLFLEKLGVEVGYIGSTKGCSKPVNIPESKNLGWMEPEKAATYGDIFVFPSVGGEGFALAPIEMMSYGKIVIAFKSGSFGELITDEVNGFLVKPFDYKKVREIIFRINTDNKLKEKISNNAIEKAKNFTVDKFRENFYGLIMKKLD